MVATQIPMTAAAATAQRHRWGRGTGMMQVCSVAGSVLTGPATSVRGIRSTPGSKRNRDEFSVYSVSAFAKSRADS